MKFKLIIAVLTTGLLLSFTVVKAQQRSAIKLNGTWILLSGTTITKGVSTVTDYTKGQQMIKIMNGTHFGFFKHDTNSKKDSTNHFDAGGGRYILKDNQYTEYLDFYADKNWENKAFNFTVQIKGDTLIQKGVEKVENENIDRVIIEKYIRLK